MQSIIGLFTFASMTTLLIDNYDSFSNNLLDYLHQLGQEVIEIRNDSHDIEAIEKIPFDNILLSPGPNNPDQAGVCLQVVARFYKEKPILGVCLGHQVIGQFFGAKVVKSNRPMHGYTSSIQLTEHALFQSIPRNPIVMRYHSLVVDQVPDCLEILATTEDHEVMILKHHSYPILGLQFHPESVLTQYGIIYLKNWFEYIR